jgi:hypothetical protein
MSLTLQVPSDRTNQSMRWLAQDLHTGFLLANTLSILCAIVVIANHVAAIMRPRHPTTIGQ